MQKNKVQILSTRPLTSKLKNEAAMHDIIIDEIAFIETKLIESKEISDAIDNYLEQDTTVIFTSMNAVDAVVKHLKRTPKWKIYCIGNTTRERVNDHFGEEAIAGIASNAEELGDTIIRDKINHAVFFCGDLRRDELPGKLKQHDVITNEVVVYNTNETPVLVSKKYNAILFFSPSAVESFFSINTVDTDTQLFAIGSTTAKAIQQYNKNNVVISGMPGKENLIRQVIGYYKNES